MNRVAAIEDHAGRDGHGQRGDLAHALAEVAPEAEHQPHTARAEQDDGHAQHPDAAAEERLREEQDVEMKRPVKIRGIVVIEALSGHLVDEPAVHALVEMRRLEIEQARRKAKASRRMNAEIQWSRVIMALTAAGFCW